MRLTAAEIVQVRMPLVAPFETSFGTQYDREVVLVRVEIDGREGWGECVTLADPFYSPEYNAGAALIIRDYLAPALAASGDLDAAHVAPALARVKGHRMAKAALELAVLDAELRAAEVPLARYLGATARTIPSGVSVGIQPSIGALIDTVEAWVAAGYVRIKLKIKPGWDVEPVRAVRERFGDIPLQVDANAAYRLSDAGHLARLDEFGLLLIEQPLSDEDLTEHAKLAKTMTTPICLDESITSAKAAADAIALGACSVVNIKAGRVGGYLEARRVHDVCAAAGVPVWCGGMLETGIGRAANMALAALENFRLPGDTSASDRFYEHDIITEPFMIDHGHIAVPDGPGLGVDIDSAALDAVTVSRESVEL